MKIHRTSTPEQMLEAFNRRIEQLGGQEEVASSTDILSATDKIESGCHGTKSSEIVIDEDLEEVTGEEDLMEELDSEFIQDDDVAASIDISSIDIDRLYDVIDKYNSSQPVSGDWDSETADEQQTIANEFGISLDDAKEIMIKVLGFPADDKFIEDSVSASIDVSDELAHIDEEESANDGAEAIECHEYLDRSGDAFGEPGMKYTEDDLRKYFEENHYSDPVLEGYGTFEEWLTDTIDNTNLEFAYVDGGCHTDVTSSEELSDTWDTWDDIVEESEWEQIDHKTVYDSDGFTTDYTLYYNPTTGQYVTIFGDRDIYRPENSDFDAEFDSEEEAHQWFDDYNTDEWAE